ncbi:uncharacterized protein LOC111339395 isoform X1 [Stylophora pistillata]|uniref:Beta/gamma crystallin 'Greek key' domain-containing protein n=1 Tax=Stylophora pistillata TaxID=50429 RepID=A0A2B4RQD4_STYPI|nr:uncharacterized protein LOC111339395 isoform X1 [Stylophora pistillata]PFX18528.1 hypothetical protein AWC38_SpisGene17091 [Stylophora pistillata]
MSIKLSTSDGLSQEFADSVKNLQKDGAHFKRAVVTSGTWIFYAHKLYNDGKAGLADYKVLQPGANEDISCVNGSMYLLEDQVEGIILFEHSNYGGERKWFEESCSDVNPYFQSGRSAGVSSAIVLSKNQQFAIFASSNYKGLQQQLDGGKWYVNPNAMKFPNDQLQSFRKI